MSSIPDGAYNFYPTPASKKPIVCEVFSGWVAEAGESNMRPLSQYVYGRFVKLREVSTVDDDATMPPEQHSGA